MTVSAASVPRRPPDAGGRGRRPGSAGSRPGTPGTCGCRRFRTIVTAAALPLLAVGTLLATKDAASAATQNNGQNGTTLNASVSAGLAQDRPTPGTRDQRRPSRRAWTFGRGDAGKVRYTVNVTEHDGQLGASASAARSRYRPTAKAFLEQKGTGSHQPLQLPRSAARAPTPEADVGYTVNEVNGTVSVVDSDPGTGVFPVACPPHRHCPGARALTKTRCLRRHPPPSRSTEAESRPRVLQAPRHRRIPVLLRRLYGS